MKSALRSHLPLLLVLLAGTALRLFRLGAESLWYDETVSVYLAGSPLPELIRHTAGDIHPPGYYVLLRGWLIAAGYPTGHADPTGIGLEFMAGFFSLSFGVLLIALTYALARRIAGRRIALLAAALVALSPYNVWYSQEARMYTLGAGLGVVAVYALLRGLANQRIGESAVAWWIVYALAAAAGMYTLYYFAFLLAPLNLWALFVLVRQRSIIPGTRWVSQLLPWLLAHLGALLLYAPWIPVAWRQVVNPPVPPWRTASNIVLSLHESWNALSLGQSAPAWLWPALLLTLALYVLGLSELAKARISESANRRMSTSANQYAQHPTRRTQYAVRSMQSALLTIATFGPLALILLVSLITPLYHVRYLFTYSPAFYIVLAAGLAWLLPRARGAFGAAALIWLAACGVTLNHFWFDPAYRADDHRAAVRFLQEHWRPGDVVLVNAGWSYTALVAYEDNSITTRNRLTEPIQVPRSDAGLVMLTVGHLDGDPSLGWGDPRADFYALPSGIARSRIAGLFERFERVWQYRIYDTVNDPNGQIRAWLAADGQPFEDQTFSGEANMRVQGFLSRHSRAAEPGWPSAVFGPGLIVRSGPLPAAVGKGETLYPVLDWQPTVALADFATSVRLVGPDGKKWAQGADERPAGSQYPASRWPAGQIVRQTAALPVPTGLPPGAYTVELVVYDPATGQSWPAQAGGLALTLNGVSLGEVTVH